MDDPRSLVGELVRGKTIHNAGSNAAHSGGGPQFGRPKKTPAISESRVLPPTFKDAVQRYLSAKRGTI